MGKVKKEIIEWIVLVGIALGLYFTGTHTEVVGMLQRVVLAPGFIKPELIPENEQQQTSYDFELIDEEGRALSFTEFKGKTVFLNLWATWCPPCVAEMPDINELYGKLKGENIAFVMLSRDKDFDSAIDFSERKSYDFPVYAATSRLPAVFSTNSIPTTFIISPAGKIVAKKTGMAKYDTQEFRDFLMGL
ncbi:MAG: TlpA disulfide reductase family protein [Cyclobacteriaceae bacterium]